MRHPIVIAKDLLFERMPRGRFRSLLGRLGWGFLGGRNSTKLVRRKINGQSLRLEVRSLGYNLEHEAHVFRWIDDHLPTNGVLLDIGAHHGLKSLPLLRKDPSRRAVLVEASSSNCQTIRHHITANSLEDRAVVHHLAVSDRDNSTETLALLGEGGSSSHHLGHLHAGLPEATGSEIVETTRIDTLVESLESKPNLIKIDVEGWEGKAIRGMAHTLASLRPYLVVALHYSWIQELGDDADDIFKMLSDHRYRIEHFNSSEEERKVGEEIACVPLA